MTQMINEDLKEMLSYRETLALVCFNINYARRFESITLEKLSNLLKIEMPKLEKASRILRRIGMAKIYNHGNEVFVEMTDPENVVVKNTIFDVMWENRYEFSMIYKELVQGELTFKTN